MLLAFGNVQINPGQTLITSIQIVFLKEDMTDIFCEILSIKEPQTLQNKETTVQSYQKISNQNTKKSPGIEFALFNCTREMGMDYFGNQTRPLSFIYIL